MQIAVSKLKKPLGGWRRRAWYGVAEMTAVILVMACADFYQVLPFSLTALHPHPFWIAVVLASSFYGRMAGYVIAIVAMLADGALRFSGLSAYEDFYDFLSASSLHAILWVAAAAILGGFREKHLERLRESEASRDQRASEAQILADRCRLQAREIAVLERRIATSGASGAGAILQIFELLLRLPPTKVMEGSKQALARLIGTNGIEVVVPSSKGWSTLTDVMKVEGATPYAGAEVRKICDIVAAADRTFSCIRASDAEILNGHAAMAAPIRSGNAELLGIIIVREADPACLTAAGEAALTLVSFIVGTRYLEPQLARLESGHADLGLQVTKSRLHLITGDVMKVGS